MASGSPIAGESYTLECSAGGSEGTFQWLKGPPDGRTPVVENSPRVTITSNAVSSQLQFRPVQQSDNGSYSCNGTIDGSAFLSDSLNVIINGIVMSLSIIMQYYYSILSIFSSPSVFPGQWRWSYSITWRRLSAHM